MNGQPPDRFRGGGELRVSDADREQVAAVLRRAAEEGRLDFIELERRLDLVFHAKTYDDLSQITVDLPTSEADLEQSNGQALSVRRVPAEVSANFSSEKVTGAWLVPARMMVRSFTGEVTLDFCEAVMPHEVIIDTSIALGSLKLIVPDDVAVVFEEEHGFLADRTNRTTVTPQLGTPLVRVRGTLILGEIEVRTRKKRRRWFRRSRDEKPRG